MPFPIVVFYSVQRAADSRWVPPGGHVEPNETFSDAARREMFEETGTKVRILSSAPIIHQPDENSTPEPVPFYIDLERFGFPRLALAQFYFVEPMNQSEFDISPRILRSRDWGLVYSKTTSQVSYF